MFGSRTHNVTSRLTPSVHVLTLLSCLGIVLACGKDTPSEVTPPEGQCDADPSNAGAWTGATGTIAYARGNEIRLIEPTGTNDHRVWTTPRSDLGYTVGDVAWRPDGGELAFTSDHEEAVSFLQRDVYAVRPDGSGLRKLTNGPTHERLASCPKGSVTVRVTNLDADGGPYLIYVLGAPAPQSAVISSGGTQAFTFTNVADLGEDVQPVVAISGANRWFGSAVADVQAGRSVDAGTLTIASSGVIANFGAAGVFWRSDASKLGFIGTPSCLVQQVAGNPPPGFSFDLLLDSEVFGSVCAVDWGPTPSLANQLLFDETDLGADEGHIYRIAEGSQSRGQPLVTHVSYDLIADLKWLPDGSGFVFAQGTNFLNAANLFEYTFATGALRQLTTFEAEFARRFSVSPDGQSIVFERAAELSGGPADLWIMDRDGTGARLLVQNAGFPAWNPTRP